MQRLSTDSAEAEAAEIIAHFEDKVFSGGKALFEQHLAETFRKARQRASAKELSFTITFQDVKDRLQASGFRCEVSNVQLSLGGLTNGYRSPFRPSIDRIDARGGYEPSNIRIVCVAVNAALSDWGDAVFWEVVRHAALKRDRHTART